MKNLGDIDTIGKAWIIVLQEILNNGKRTLYNGNEQKYGKRRI